MSRGLTGLGVIAVAAPICGGLVVERFGRHAALLALAPFGGEPAHAALPVEQPA
jgi:DHA1 family bicyclomycin/chloramphenicol resistance-like MFS transporter